MRRILFVLISSVFLSGCALFQQINNPAKQQAVSQSVPVEGQQVPVQEHGKKLSLTEKQQLEIQIAQIRAISETGLEVSKNAEKYAHDSYNTSTQANATSEKALEAANKAIEAAQNAVKSANDASQKAIQASNEAADRATAAAEKSAKTAMEYADQSSQKAIDAANQAIKAANDASEKAINAANQIMTELGRVKATIKTEPYHPVLPEEPKVIPVKKHILKKKVSHKKAAKKVSTPPAAEKKSGVQPGKKSIIQPEKKPVAQTGKKPVTQTKKNQNPAGDAKTH